LQVAAGPSRSRLGTPSTVAFTVTR
jgi:hypothetical protein